ncbi:MAG: alpha-L-fucosidase, partial [Firmicutes bacterium]|nr:alpha-L-fucosidase [Bacillota bacterium]
MSENEKWYRSSYRRCLVDMHIPDWDKEYFFSKFDSKAYIEAMKTAGVDTAYFYCNSCTGICNWPTKTGHMHDGLKGRDIVRELSEGLKAAGINVIAYINIWSRWAALEHPDWQCLDEDGRPTLEFQWGQPGRYGECCMNSPYRDYVLSLVRELCENYDFIGLWVDMILWRVMCYCPHCKKRFRDETGHELPEKVDWNDPAWRLWLKKREEWNYAFFKDVIDTAKSYKPDLTVMCNSSYLPSYFMGQSLEYFRLGEFIGGDYSMERHGHSFECKLFNSVTSHKPFEFLGSVMDPSLYEHSIVKSPEHLRSLMGSTLLNNGRYGFIDAIDPSGTLNPRVYERMHGIYEFERGYEKYLRPEVDFVCDVGLYTNLESAITPEANGQRVNRASPSSKHQASVRQMAVPLIENHIPFAVLTR